MLRIELLSEERDGGGGGGGGGTRRKAVLAGTCVLESVDIEDDEDKDGCTAGEDDVDRGGTFGGGGGLETRDFVMLGSAEEGDERCGNIGVRDFQWAVARSQSRLISLSVAGLVTNAEETSS